MKALVTIMWPDGRQDRVEAELFEIGINRAGDATVHLKFDADTAAAISPLRMTPAETAWVEAILKDQRLENRRVLAVTLRYDTLNAVVREVGKMSRNVVIKEGELC